MIIECHVILVKNLAENFNKSSDESFIAFCFDLAAQNCHDSTDQNSHCIAESYSSFF